MVTDCETTAEFAATEEAGTWKIGLINTGPAVKNCACREPEF